MDSELRQYMRQALLSQATVGYLQSRLPDDAELDRWLREATDERTPDEFIYLTLAALADGRPLDARHLVYGAAMIDAAGLLPDVAMRVTGDTTKYLMQAVQDSCIDDRGKAYALAIAGILAKDRGVEIPLEITTLARAMSRDPNMSGEAISALHGLAAFLRDDELAGEIRRQHYAKIPEQQWRTLSQTARGFAERLLKMRRTPIMDVIPERTVRVLASGHETMRRAASRLGRNEPCHCSSGKKYKHCCLEKDQARLRESSDVEGLTKSEQDSMPEDYLTAQRLQLMAVNRLAAIDPLRVPFELLPYYLERLAATREFDRAAKAFEEIGYHHELENIWTDLVSASVFAGHKDAALRLMQLRKAAGFTDDELPPVFQFFPIDGDPAKSWEWIDRQALNAVKSGQANDLRSLANGVLLSKHLALGVLLSRGVIPLLKTPAEASAMLEPLLAARERLNLGPEEPIGSVVDMLWAAKSDAVESDSEVRELREMFDLKRRESDELKQTLERARREAKRSEAALKNAAFAKSAEPVEPEVLKESRRKMGAMEQAIREKNAELQNLRRELVRKDAEAEARNNPALDDSKEAERDSAAEAEEELLLAPGSEINQPIRLIEFPRHFEQRLSAVPRHIARKALAKLGGLAGGEPSEFVGAVQLKACPSVTRVRIGIDHRLLFRLLTDRLQVVDLIPRSDLERKVKILSTQYD